MAAFSRGELAKQAKDGVLRRGPEQRESAPFLVPILAPARKLEFAVLGVLWLATLVSFWLWWFQPGHRAGMLPYVVESLILAWLSFCPLYFFLIVFFGRKPNPERSVARGYRVAMVVTKAPSEPFDVVRETMEAMLRQTYPHDTWLADEDPQPATIAWCEAHGIKISTRKGRADYHRPTWPRRTRCKEGNLAFFYDHYGYGRYDFVSQLDADHVPDPTYLEEMLKPFADPRIGYVSAPSICDRNAVVSWSARSRLYVEAPMHGAMQAGYTNGFTPLCIGSHYAVRVAALKEIGGLGPELAEDHSTTLFLAAHGWRGVHAIDAIAHGDGPANFTDLVTQEFQWSRSLVSILLQYTPHLIGRLPARLVFQFLFCQLWYPFLSLVSLGMFIIPVVALLFDINLTNVTYPEFVLHAAPPALLLTAIVIRLAAVGLCRPVGARVLSWEGPLYLLVRWPWVLIGTVTALRDWWTGAPVAFRVTPKGAATHAGLPIRVVLPFAVIAVLSALPVLLLSDIQNARGFYFIALLNAIFYTILTLVVFIAHRQENGGVFRASFMTGADRAAWSAVLAAVVLLPLAALPVRLRVGLAAILRGGQDIIVLNGWVGLALLASAAFVVLRLAQVVLVQAARRGIAVGAEGRGLIEAERRLATVSDFLRAWKAVDPDVLDASLKAERETGISLDQILARRRAIDLDTLAKAISLQANLPTTELSAQLLVKNARLLPQAMCIRWGVLPAGVNDNGSLVVAVARPLADGAISEIAGALGRDVVQRIAPVSDIRSGLRFLRGSRYAFARQSERTVPLLGELLIEAGFVDPAALRQALDKYDPSVDGRLGEYLVQNRVVGRAALDEVLASQRTMMAA